MGSPNQAKPQDRFAAIAEESFALSHWLTNAEKFVTHVNADLDALLSVVLAQVFRTAHGLSLVPVEFVPGGIHNFPTGVLALDIGPDRGLRSTPQGGMMVKSSATAGSACMAILRTLPLEEQNILHALVKEISKSDEDGRNAPFRALDELYEDMVCARPDDIDMHEILNKELKKKKAGLFCTSVYDQFHSLKRSGWKDHMMYDFVSDWVGGMLSRGRDRNRVQLVTNNWIDVRKVFGGKLAILSMGGLMGDSRIAHKQGAELTLYCGMLRSNPNNWALVLNKGSGHVDLEGLFRDRMNDFPNIGIRPTMVGWSSKGGGVWVRSRGEMESIRERFIKRVVDILTPWYASPRH